MYSGTSSTPQPSWPGASFLPSAFVGASRCAQRPQQHGAKLIRCFLFARLREQRSRTRVDGERDRILTPSSTCSSTFIIKSNLGQIKRVEEAGEGEDVAREGLTLASETRPKFHLCASSAAVSRHVKETKQQPNTDTRRCLLKCRAGSPDVLSRPPQSPDLTPWRLPSSAPPQRPHLLSLSTN